MQPLAPTGTQNPNSHTEAEVRTALLGKTGSRKFTFRYELLDTSNDKILDLDNIISCKVENNFLADIKRKALFTVRDDGIINFLIDRIKPWIRLHLSPYGADDYVEWPQGVFILSTPSRSSDNIHRVTREVEGYDLIQVYSDDLVQDRYAVASGTNYVTAIETLLGSVDKNVTATTKTLTTTKEWEPGTAKQQIINDLASAINYESLSADENGAMIIKPYVLPEDRAEEWTYADDDESLIIPGVEQTLDLFNQFNHFVLVVSNPDQAAMVATYTNDDPTSPLSTVRRGRTITDFRTLEEESVDQATLNAKVERIAFESTRIFEAINFTTGMMPIHSGSDVFRIAFSPLAINAKYSDHTWEMEFKAGATMAHTARRVVVV